MQLGAFFTTDSFNVEGIVEMLTRRQTRNKKTGNVFFLTGALRCMHQGSQYEDALRWGAQRDGRGVSLR